MIIRALEGRVPDQISSCILTVLPDDLLDTARRVVTPSVVLPATESTSIQKDTQEITTIKIVGMYDWTMWKPKDLLRYNSARRQL